METPEKQSRAFPVFKVIWGALLLSQGMYVFVVFKEMLASVDPSTYRWFPDFRNPVEAVTSFAALGSFLLAVFVPTLIARANIRRAKDGGEKVELLLPPFIVRLAFLEGVCLTGFALAIMVKNPAVLMPFFVVSVFGYLKNFPASPAKVRADLGV
jgi:hypothetical protein